MNLTNEEANSPLGINSRKLAFAIISCLHKDWYKYNLDELQAGLYYFGDALAKEVAELVLGAVK